MNESQIVIARLLRGTRLATLVIALSLQFGLNLTWVLQNLDVYRWPALEIAGFALYATIAAGLCAWQARGWPKWALLGAVVAVWVLNIVDTPPEHLASPAAWSGGPAGWLILVLLLEHGFAVVATVLVTQLAIGSSVLFATAPPEPAVVALLTVLAVTTLGFQLGIAFVNGLLRRIATTTAEATGERERLRTAETIADQLHRDRRERYAHLGVVPLLTGLASGELDPADEQVRRSCAVVAGRMRRLFAERDDVPDPLLHELGACVDLAERRGLTVHLGTWGHRPVPPLPVRRALTEPAMALVATAASHVRVSVIGSATTVTVSVVTDGVPVPVPEGGEVAVTQLVHGERVWLEATWQAR
jgi:hypothetical protein